MRQSVETLVCSRRLFAEDFDFPDIPEPEVIGPADRASDRASGGGFTQADLAAARADAWAEGRAAAEAAARVSGEAAARSIAEAAASLAREIGDIRADLLAEAEVNARAIARLLLDTLAALFPTLCARHGEAEARAVTRALLPGLRHEPEIVLRAAPRIGDALAAEIAGILPDDAERVRLIADPTMKDGDVRLWWRGGSAARNGAALWEEVAAVLTPAGLLSAHALEAVDVE